MTTAVTSLGAAHERPVVGPPWTEPFAQVAPDRLRVALELALAWAAREEPSTLAEVREALR